jgi:hypothetical protein
MDNIDYANSLVQKAGRRRTLCVKEVLIKIYYFSRLLLDDTT